MPVEGLEDHALGSRPHVNKKKGLPHKGENISNLLVRAPLRGCPERKKTAQLCRFLRIACIHGHCGSGVLTSHSYETAPYGLLEYGYPIVGDGL